MAEAPVDDAGREPGASRSARAGGGALSVATGLFSLIVGLLLRGNISGQDRTDWNGAVRTFLDVFPLLLIVGGAVLLIVAFVRMASRPGAPRDGAGVSRAAPGDDATAGSVAPTGRARRGRELGGRAYAAEQREALARLKADRERRDS